MVCPRPGRGAQDLRKAQSMSAVECTGKVHGLDLHELRVL